MEQNIEQPKISSEDEKQFRQEIMDRAVAEQKKLEDYGKFGQEVKIVGRSISPEGEVRGKIVGIETHGFFDDQAFGKWMEAGDMKFVPGSTIKVYVTEGERKGQIVENVVASEWRAIE